MSQPRFLTMVFSLLLVFPLVGAALAQPGTTPANPRPPECPAVRTTRSFINGR